MLEKNDADKFTGILFELKIGLNKDNAIVIDYGGKPVGRYQDDKVYDAPYGGSVVGESDSKDGVGYCLLEEGEE